MNEPKCPKCNSKDLVYADETTPSAWWCQRCKICFDNDPDEGGDWSNDPTRRIERQERRKRKPSNGMLYPIGYRRHGR